LGELLLGFTNHPEVKIWMHNQESISEEGHFGFIKNLETDIEKCYFLVKQKGNIIGSINF
jgi:UDP-4-amino-4,6-dideoxy-N-acetyl-beta-L-altrosamine N-acetyltransferase